MLSLPALGGLRMHARARRAVRSLVSAMADPNTEDEHRVALPRRARPLAPAPGHGARQPSVAVGARAEVCARGGAGDRSRGHDQLDGLAARGLAVVVAPGGGDDRLGRPRRRLARDRRRAVGPPRRRLPAGAGKVASLQRLDAADLDGRRAHLLPRPLRRELGVGVLRPRPRRDGRLPPRLDSATATCSSWPGSSPRPQPSAGASAPAWSRTRRSAPPPTPSARRTGATASRAIGTPRNPARDGPALLHDQSRAVRSIDGPITMFVECGCGFLAALAADARGSVTGPLRRSGGKRPRSDSCARGPVHGNGRDGGAAGLCATQVLVHPAQPELPEVRHRGCPDVTLKAFLKCADAHMHL